MKIMIIIIAVIFAGCSVTDGKSTDGGVLDTETEYEQDGSPDAAADASPDGGDDTETEVPVCFVGDYIVEDVESMETIDEYDCIEGGLSILGDSLTSVSLQNLQWITGQLHIESDTLESVGLESLHRVGDGGKFLIISNCTHLDYVDLGSLVEIRGALRLASSYLKNLDLRALETVEGEILIRDTGMEGLNNLESLSGIIPTSSSGGASNFNIWDNENLPDCSVCDLLSQIDEQPSWINVVGNLSDECSSVPDNCP